MTTTPAHDDDWIGSRRNPHNLDAAGFPALMSLLATIRGQCEERFLGEFTGPVAVYAHSVVVMLTDAAASLLDLAPAGGPDRPFRIPMLLPQLAARWAIEAHVRLAWLTVDPQGRLRSLEADAIRQSTAIARALGEQDILVRLEEQRARYTNATPWPGVEQAAKAVGLEALYVRYRVLCSPGHLSTRWLPADVARGADGAWRFAVETFTVHYHDAARLALPMMGRAPLRLE